jgi:hypothetical protein
MVLIALSRAGGPKYLEQQAHKNPVAFLTLVGKILPLTINATIRQAPENYSTRELIGLLERAGVPLSLPAPQTEANVSPVIDAEPVAAEIAAEVEEKPVDGA